MTKQLVPMEAAWIAVVRAALPADLKGLCLAPDDWYDGMDESNRADKPALSRSSVSSERGTATPDR